LDAVGHQAALALNLPVGENCLIARYLGWQVRTEDFVFSLFEFDDEIVEGQLRIFVAEQIEDNGIIERRHALVTYPYADFFNKRGDFLRMSVPPVRMTELLIGLLKWGYIQDLRNASLRDSVRAKRNYIEARARVTPQLDPRSQSAHWLAGSYADAARSFTQPMPNQCPWTIPEIMNPNFWP
jgi:hypothetical protein